MKERFEFEKDGPDRAGKHGRQLVKRSLGKSQFSQLDLLARRTVLVSTISFLVALLSVTIIFFLPQFAHHAGPVTTPAASDSPDSPHRSPVLPAEFTVEAGKLFWIPLRWPPSSKDARIVGSFTASGELFDDIEVFVTDKSGLSALRAGESLSASYSSGKVSSGSLDLYLPSGDYYLVFSNLSSLFFNTKVLTEIELQY